MLKSGTTNHKEPKMPNATADLGTLVAQTTMRAAVSWWNANVTGIKASDAADRLLPAIKAHAKAALTEALADAKQAMDAGMKQTMMPTFLASFQVAGIAAAKEVARDMGIEVVR